MLKSDSLTAARPARPGHGVSSDAMSGQPTPPGAYLSAKEVATLLGVSLRTVRRWIAEGTLPAARLGGVVRIRRADLDRRLDPTAPARPPTRRPSRGKG